MSHSVPRKEDNMPLTPKIQALRDRAFGHAVYILDPPEDRCPYLRGAGFGIIRTVSAFHREHPHSAYLFGPAEGEEGSRRTQTLVLPTGSLKRTQILTNGVWENETEYCMRPHHWGKLGLHLTDLTAVTEHYPAQSAGACLEAGDLLALSVPWPILEFFLREFTSPEFLQKSLETDAASVRKAIRQTEPYLREALSACSAVESDLYLLDDRRAPVCPDAASDILRDEYKALRSRLTGRTLLSLTDRDDPRLPGTVLRACADPVSIPENASLVLLGEGWKDCLTDWKQTLCERKDLIFFLPWEAESLTEIAVLSPEEEQNSCAEAEDSVQ